MWKRSDSGYYYAGRAPRSKLVHRNGAKGAPPAERWCWEASFDGDLRKGKARSLNDAKAAADHAMRHLIWKSGRPLPAA